MSNGNFIVCFHRKFSQAIRSIPTASCIMKYKMLTDDKLTGPRQPPGPTLDTNAPMVKLFYAYDGRGTWSSIESCVSSFGSIIKFIIRRDPFNQLQWSTSSMVEG